MLANACGDGSPLTACELSLRWCADHRKVVAALGYSRERLSLLDQLSRRFEEVLHDRLSMAMELDGEDAEDLADIVRDVEKRTALPSDDVAAAAVRAFAEVVDRYTAPRFLEEFREMEQGDGVARGVRDAVPIVHADLKAIFGRLRARPERLDSSHHRTRSLTLVPDDATVGVRLHCARPGVDLDLRRGAVLATGLPMSSLDDLQCLVPEAFWMAPHDPERNLERVRRILATVGDAAICLLPELCLADGQIEQVEEMIPVGPSVVFAGSAHVETEGRKRNVGYLWFDGRWFHHHKFRPYSQGDRMEPIVTDPAELQIVVTDRWTLSFVICKDLLPRETARLLADLGVRVVLVAACSEKLQDFVAAAEQITTYSQGIVLIANTTGDPEAASTLLAEPSAEARLRALKRQEIQPPAVVRLTLGTTDEPSVTSLPDV